MAQSVLVAVRLSDKRMARAMQSRHLWANSRQMKHHAYVIKWKDSSTHRGWREIGGDHIASDITSVGWLVNQTPKTVTITTSISHCGNVVDPLTIPREAVTKMTKLKNYILGH